MLDWNPPRPEEKCLRMEDYVLDFIPDCVRRVQQDSGEQDVSVIGYCFGGVLSLLYGSIFPEGPMKNLICFTTPIDFRGMKLFSNFADRRYFDVDRLIDGVGGADKRCGSRDALTSTFARFFALCDFRVFQHNPPTAAICELHWRCGSPRSADNAAPGTPIAHDPVGFSSCRRQRRSQSIQASPISRPKSIPTP